MKDFYASEDYSKTLVAAEDTIQSYLQELQRCEAMCEGPYDHKDSTDFYIAIAGVWSYRVRNVKFARNLKFATSKTLVNFMKKIMFYHKIGIFFQFKKP